MWKAVLLLVALLAWPVTAQAITGNDLLRECRDRDPYSRGYCLGLIVGVEAGASVAQTLDEIVDPLKMYSKTFGNCLPSRVSHGQMRDVVVRFLEQNPAKRHESFHLLVLEAFNQAFPCQPIRR
jgi:hypothetical protein